MLSKHSRKTRQAFTLVELLVVVLILAILMAVALPLYLGAIRNSEKGTARANMQTIANANQSFKLKDPNHQYATDVQSLSDDLGNGTTTIAGPGDRQYVIQVNTGTTATACSGTGTPTGDIPAGGFGVYTTSGDANVADGCFVPGVTSQ